MNTSTSEANATQAVGDEITSINELVGAETSFEDGQAIIDEAKQRRDEAFQAQHPKKDTKPVNPLTQKFPALSASFARGSFDGQLASVLETLKNTAAGDDGVVVCDKASQFKQALMEGDIEVPANSLLIKPKSSLQLV